MDRGIMFSGAMVRALLAGTKTQTRRLATSPLRHVKPGDRLYVRETGNWSTVKSSIDGGSFGFTFYAADSERGRSEFFDDKNRPAIHMPRWVSRLTLVVTENRRQDLWNISSADAIAEGLLRASLRDLDILEQEIDGKLIGIPESELDELMYRGSEALEWSSCPRVAYFKLWDSLHGAPATGLYDQEIVAISFTVERCNIDRLPAQEAAAA